MNFNVSKPSSRFSGKEFPNVRVQVSGPKNTGVVTVHMIKGQGQRDFEYQLLALDVKGMDVSFQTYCCTLGLSR